MRHTWSFIEIIQKLSFRFFLVGKQIVIYLGYKNLVEANSDSLFLQKLSRSSDWFYKRDWKGFNIRNHTLSLFLRYGTTDKKVLKQIFFDQEYYPIIDLIKKRCSIQNIRVLVDVGSNIGLSAIWFSNQFPNMSRLVCVEPDNQNFKALTRNINQNFNSHEVVLVNKALWSVSNIQLSLTSAFRDGESWSKSVTEGVLKADSVRSITLEDLLLNCEIKGVDILKIDIEGAEVKLLNSPSFITTIKDEVRFLAIEIHEEVLKLNRAIEILREAKFDCFVQGETLFAYNTSLISS